MDLYLKIIAGVLLTVVVCLVLSKQGKDFSVMLVIMGCCMCAAGAAKYLQQIISFLEKLQLLGNLNSELISVLLKTAGIGILSEIVSLICTDSGNGALGKTLQILSTGVILWLAIPVFTQLMELVEDILGTV